MKHVVQLTLVAILAVCLAAQLGCPALRSTVPAGDDTSDAGDTDGDGSQTADSDAGDTNDDETTNDDQNDDGDQTGCNDDEYAAGGERIGVLKSTDSGATWEFLGHACFHAPELTPVDPCPTYDQGQIVLYFFDIAVMAGGDGEAHVMYRAVSDDGLEFSEPTAAFSSTELQITDPHVIQLPDGTYRMYLSEGARTPSATSTDGITFTVDDGYRSVIGGVPGVVELDDARFRMFVCGDGIDSLISDDGLEFEAEDGTRISGDGDIICDPHPIKLTTGGYLMTYKIRPAGVEGPGSDEIHLATSSDALEWTADADTTIRLGSVPGIVEIDNGTLLIYFVDFNYDR